MRNISRMGGNQEGSRSFSEQRRPREDFRGGQRLTPLGRLRVSPKLNQVDDYILSRGLMSLWTVLKSGEGPEKED